MKLKVCGMKYEDNIKAVAQLQPDYLGFIFYDKSSRYLKTPIPKLPDTITKVGVFVDESLASVIDKVITHNLHAVQLHGDESPEYCKALISHLASGQHHINIELIKAFSLDDDFDFEVLQPYEEICHYFLFDTKGKLPGGNGYTFNWTVLKKYTLNKPYFLSGGIGLNEIENIISFLSEPESKYCHAIDINSKFEIKAGLKDIKKVETFKKNIITT